jgi:hypothetical protein
MCWRTWGVARYTVRPSGDEPFCGEPGRKNARNQGTNGVRLDRYSIESDPIGSAIESDPIGLGLRPDGHIATRPDLLRPGPLRASSYPQHLIESNVEGMIRA